MHHVIHSFRPVVNERSRVLILGSVPGVESLRKGQYYANPRNQFWPIIYGIFGKKPDSLYDRRIEFLLEQGIALWDVIAKCEREGSLDKNIKNERPNEIGALIVKYRGIRMVAFNGSKAYETYRKKIGFERAKDLVYQRLPSTSPVPAKNPKSLAEKLEEWRIITAYLD